MKWVSWKWCSCKVEITFYQILLKIYLLQWCNIRSQDIVLVFFCRAVSLRCDRNSPFNFISQICSFFILVHSNKVKLKMYHSRWGGETTQCICFCTCISLMHKIGDCVTDVYIAYCGYLYWLFSIFSREIKN